MKISTVKVSLGRFLVVVLVGTSFFISSGCSLFRRNADADIDDVSSHAQQPVDSSAQKIDTLTAALSRAQTRIEELDAKIAVLQDNLSSTKNVVDNMSGSKDVKTVGVGKNSDGVAETPEETQQETPVVPQGKRHTKRKTTKANTHETTAETAETTDESMSGYAKAMEIFRRGNFSDAILAFNHFVELYPDHPLAGSAQYHAAESYFLLGEYKLALSEYHKVLTTFRSSPRVPAAMVRIAHVYSVMRKSQESEKAMAIARNLYAGHPALDWPAPQVASRTEPVVQRVSGVSTEKKAVATKPTGGDLEASPMEPQNPSENKPEEHAPTQNTETTSLH